MTLCEYSDVLGIPGEGIHKIRVPFTTTAAADYVMTIILAWAIAAMFKTSLVTTTIVLFVLSVILHAIFCVQIG